MIIFKHLLAIVLMFCVFLSSGNIVAFASSIQTVDNSELELVGEIIERNKDVSKSNIYIHDDNTIWVDEYYYGWGDYKYIYYSNTLEGIHIKFDFTKNIYRFNNISQEGNAHFCVRNYSTNEQILGQWFEYSNFAGETVIPIDSLEKNIVYKLLLYEGGKSKACVEFYVVDDKAYFNRLGNNSKNNYLAHLEFIDKINERNPQEYLEEYKNSDFFYNTAKETHKFAIELTKNCKNDSEKVNTIAAWIYNNIIYDLESLENSSSYADVILAKKNGKCHEHAILLRAMLNAVNIPCIYVEDCDDNHAFNIAYINGEWITIDSTNAELCDNIYSPFHTWINAYYSCLSTLYTISYNLNGGKNNSLNPNSYYETTNTISLKDPIRTGYTFKGWYSDKEFKNKVTEIKKGSTGNITLYAKWEKNAVSIESAKVKLSSSSYTYNGKTKTPSVTVTLNGKKLRKNTDYKVTYTNNKNIGYATVKITGINDYKGSITKKFTIKAKKGATFTSNKCKYEVTSSSTVKFTGITSSSMKKVTIPKTVKYGGQSFKVTEVGKNALKNKSKLTTVVIGANVKTIGVSAFEGCKKLSKVTIGSAVTTIDDKAFKNCTVLKSITIPSKVTKIDKEAFCGCKNLKTIAIKSTKLKTVGKNALKSIYAKATIKVPSSKLKSYKNLLKNKGQGSKVKIVKMK